MLGKQVVAIICIPYYGGQTIEKGMYGVIEDFDSKPPYVGVLWNNGLRGAALLDKDVALLEKEHMRLLHGN